MIPFQFCAFLICSPLLYAGVFAFDDFHKACVVTHNKLRKLHGAQGLAYSEELGDEAQKWCEELAIKDDLSHDNNTMDTKNQGENLAATPVSDAKSVGATPDLCTLAVQKWYAEEANYNYQTGLPKGPGMPIKHFAQVVWNSTFQIGVGTARSTVHGDIICVRYNPRGAEGGPDSFKENVFPKGSMSNDSSVKDVNCSEGGRDKIGRFMNNGQPGEERENLRTKTIRRRGFYLERRQEQEDKNKKAKRP